MVWEYVFVKIKFPCYPGTGKLAALSNSANADLSRRFTFAQVAEKHGWTDPMVWSLALEGRKDHGRFKAFG